MSFDPYFTSNGARDFTCLSQPRAIYTAAEKAEADRMLALPEKEKVRLACDLFDKRHCGQFISPAEYLFHEAMMKRSRIRGRMHFQRRKVAA
jgi:hypothetical protein